MVSVALSNPHPATLDGCVLLTFVCTRVHMSMLIALVCFQVDHFQNSQDSQFWQLSRQAAQQPLILLLWAVLHGNEDPWY